MAFLKGRFALCALFLGSLLAGSCFSPNQPACAFSCAQAGLCPDGYTCGSDKICHKDGTTDTCPLGDGAAPDSMSSPDAAMHD